MVTGSSGPISADFNSDGIINLYNFREYSLASIRKEILRAWSGAAATTSAARLEVATLALNFSNPDDDKHPTVAERFAEIGSQFLHADPDYFFVLVDREPLLAVIMAEIVKEELQKRSNRYSMTPLQEATEARISFIDFNVTGRTDLTLVPPMQPSAELLRNALQRWQPKLKLL